ncbi:MAG TPA: hypothetical protein VGF28_02635 [Thermoanaerobaculia bacterium]
MLDPVDLAVADVPRPHFLRKAALFDSGRSLVGELVISSAYTAVADRHGRVNAAEGLHAVWNAAHLISQAIGGKQLRATRITITPGRRPLPSDKPLLIRAHLPELVFEGRDARGNLTAEILDKTGRSLLQVEAEFWARRDIPRNASTGA